jgi:hypothetical protein
MVDDIVQMALNNRPNDANSEDYENLEAIGEDFSQGIWFISCSDFMFGCQFTRFTSDTTQLSIQSQAPGWDSAQETTAPASALLFAAHFIHLGDDNGPASTPNSCRA